LDVFKERIKTSIVEITALRESDIVEFMSTAVKEKWPGAVPSFDKTPYTRDPRGLKGLKGGVTEISKFSTKKTMAASPKNTFNIISLKEFATGYGAAPPVDPTNLKDPQIEAHSHYLVLRAWTQSDREFKKLCSK
jgi:hypothetical protein